MKILITGVTRGLGRALAWQGKLDEGALHFREAVHRDPQYKEALLSLASLYEESKRIPEAVAIYAEFPENAAAQQRPAGLERGVEIGIARAHVGHEGGAILRPGASEGLGEAGHAAVMAAKRSARRKRNFRTVDLS